VDDNRRSRDFPPGASGSAPPGRAAQGRGRFYGSALLGIGLILLLAGCSGHHHRHRQAQIAEQQGDWNQAVLHYMELVERHPENFSYRSGLLRAKLRASQAHFERGKRFHEAGSLERALLEYRQAVELDPTNQYAMTEMERVRQEIEVRRSQDGELRTVEEMKRAASQRLQPPLLSPRSTDPISLEFPRPVSVKDIYRALGKAFGINILFDPNLRDQEIAIELIDVTAQDALEILMRAAQHFYKTLDEHTILIAADTPQNRRIYEDLVIQTFFLSNADSKDVLTILRSLVDAKRAIGNERLNAIVMRDTADRVRVAQRIIETADKARAEVVVDVELLQINSQKVRELGVSLSDYVITQQLDLGSSDAVLRFSDLAHLTQNHWALTIPSFIYTFVKQSTDAQVLARPQLRITEGEKATLHIGDRVPVPTTTFSTGATVGGNIIPITSFQYTDIGIKIEIEPRVHHNLEVTLNLKVEVSNIAGSVTGPQGQEQPIIGTRNISSTIRLKDGETNFLAGLLRTDETSSDLGIPGLSDIPVLGRLFSKTSRNAQRTDVILTMTPHIIRKSDITEEDLLPIWVGTEQNITFRGGSPRVESDVEGPFDEGTSAAERVRELIRQRVQELPRGLQGEAPVDNGEELREPPAIDLAPAQPPTDIFAPPPEPPEPEDWDREPQESSSLPGGASGELVGEVTFAAHHTAPEGDHGVEEASEGVTLRLLPERHRVARGQRFTVEIEVSSESPLSHIPFKLLFDPQTVAVVGWERRSFLGEQGVAQVLVAEEEEGVLLVGASRLGAEPGVTGRGPVAAVTFEALHEGSSRLSVVEARALGPGLDELPLAAAPLAEVLVLPERPLAPSAPKEL
jgi:general secretion pathway protein D